MRDVSSQIVPQVVANGMHWCAQTASGTFGKTLHAHAEAAHEEAHGAAAAAAFRCDVQEMWPGRSCNIHVRTAPRRAHRIRAAFAVLR